VTEAREPERLSRRDFLRWSGRLAGAFLTARILQACQRLGWIDAAEGPAGTGIPGGETAPAATPVITISPRPAPTVSTGLAKVALVQTRDRGDGARRALTLLAQNPLTGNEILVKPNFNSADPAPASTHLDTLRALIEFLQAMGPAGITVVDRSGMGDTRRVMEGLGVFAMAEALGFEAVVLDEETRAEDWLLVRTDGDHWKNGFPIPRRLLEAQAVVQTCCLKPHRFGGHFTLSLKNSVGLVGKYIGGNSHNFMSELHNSPAQRLMIAEINAVYDPALILLDGVEAFIDNGPEAGTRVRGDVMLAATDRVAIDAVGLAILRSLGYTGIAAAGPIFAQEQIARAVELGLGVDGVEKIEFVTDDPDSAAYAARIRERMLQSG